MVRTDNKGRLRDYGDDKKKKISINDASTNGSVMDLEKMRNQRAMPRPTGVIRHRDGTIEYVYDDDPSEATFQAHKRGMDEHNKKVEKDPSYRSYNPQTDKA